MYRKEYTERKHVIDFLFPLALFFALAASSVALVILASGSYSRQVHTSEDSYASCTALSYVTEKLHQITVTPLMQELSTARMPS